MNSSLSFLISRDHHATVAIIVVVTWCGNDVCDDDKNDKINPVSYHRVGTTFSIETVSKTSPVTEIISQNASVILLQVV